MWTNVILDLVAMVERVRIFQEATDANAEQDSLVNTVKSVHTLNVILVLDFSVASLDRVKFSLYSWFQSFLFIVVIVTSILLKSVFQQTQSKVSYKWKIYRDRKRIKSHFRRLKNIGIETRLIL